MKPFCFLSLCLFLFSCASKRVETEHRQTLSEWYSGINSNQGKMDGYKQDSSGNWKSSQTKRSSFELAGQSPYFKGNYQAKDLKKRDYSTKSWWGDKKNFGSPAYAGNTDGSRFQKNSRLSDQNAPEAKSKARLHDPYKTNDYATGNARETSSPDIGTPSDTETDIRRRVFPQPDIVDWKEQRAMSIEQSKGILGR